uniref:Cysteine proteinase CG12163 n=1 Tax=Cacopsylla melanoneura TaxID=428564 RepID=A0A8D8XD30_9HEMI
MQASQSEVVYLFVSICSPNPKYSLSVCLKLCMKMKAFVLCALVFASVNCYRVARSPTTMSPADDTLTLLGQMKTNNELPASSAPENFDKFEKFIRDFKKSYATKEELSKRFTIFVENLKTIENLNKGEHGSATYGINHLADLTKEELRGGLGLNLNLGKDKLKPDPSP